MFNGNSKDIFIQDSRNCPYCGNRIDFIALKQVLNSMSSYHSNANNRAKLHVKGKKVIAVVECDKCLSEFEVYYTRDGDHIGEEKIDPELKL